MAGNTSRFQVQFEVDGDGRVTAAMNDISVAAKSAAADATASFKAMDDAAYNFGFAIGETVKSATLALGALAVAGLGLVAKNSIDTQNELAQLEAVLKSTGQSASFSAAQILEMANNIAKNSNFSGGDITNAATRLLSYSGVVTEKFAPALQVAIDQAARLGISVEQSAETVGRALESPKKAAAALAQQGFGAAFTKEVRNGIAALVDAGKEAEAQQAIIDILNESYKGAAAAARDTLGGAFIELKNVAADLLQGDSNGEGLKGVRQGVEDLIDTLMDPGVQSGFQSLIALMLQAAGAAAKLVGNLGQKLGTGLQVAGLQDGSLKLGDASTEALRQYMANTQSARAYAQQWDTTLLGFDRPSLEKRRKQSLANYDKEIAALEAELAKRKVTVLLNEGNPGDPQPAARNTPRQVVPIVEDPELVKKRLAEQAAAAKKLENAYTRLKDSMQQGLAVGSQAADQSEVAKVRYETEQGALKNLTEAKKQDLLAIADRVDQMRRELDMDRQLQEMDDRRQAVVDNISAERAELGLSNDQLEIRRNLILAGVTAESGWGKAIITATTELQKQRDASRDQVDVMDTIRSAGKDLFDGAIDSADSFGDVAVAALKRVAASLADILIFQPLIEQLFGETGTGKSGSASGWVSALGGAIAGLFGTNSPSGKASGGAVRAGSIHEVAEGGAPELLRTNGRTYLLNGSDGTVIPASAAASGGAGAAVAPNVVLNFHGADGSAVQGEVSSQSWDGNTLNLDLLISQSIARDAATNGAGIRTQQQVLGLRRKGVQLG